MSSDSIRRKIETLGTQMSLPTVRKALGVLEGEHASGRRGGNGDVMDVRAYEPGDESRLIDWKTSARQGHPMVVQRERLSTSRVWLLMDVGREMTGVCPSGEQAYEIAANALRMFAALSLRRADDVSIVFGDESSITRIPFNGGFAQFERTLDASLQRAWKHKRNIDALLEYARRIRDRHALIVLATDELAIAERHLVQFRRIARTHPIVLIDVATLNPFKPLAKGHAAPLDGTTNRAVPAFMRSKVSAQQVATHRQYLAAALEQELNRTGSFMIRADSSEDMFNRFVQLVSVALARTTRNQLGEAPELMLAGDRS
ncbi:DUF58 domain-containing protein [Bifidobacterium felsineum]|uniref:DUF58 domain-containing protein n=1 Tax=Bifidobacterium felsineum TaxID=2045440 RepID=UPI001A9CB035|nr:DUF58 domain-containing protein [Bifidobacterium felsineum]MBT1164177.1 DUF58 domain-containing protein [Bifidobacterium felsineum]